MEARGHYVMPGGIDPHTHFQTEFMGAATADDFYSGSRAALAGGTTTVINHVFDEKNRGLVEAFDRVRKSAEDKVCCDFGLHVAVTGFSDPQKVERDMETLVQERGVSSFKVFMAYKGSFQLTDLQLIKVFDVCKKVGAVPLVHAENGDVIDFLSKKLIRGKSLTECVLFELFTHSLQSCSWDHGTRGSRAVPTGGRGSRGRASRGDAG